MRCLYAFSLLVLATAAAWAQHPELVADIVPGPDSSNPRFFGEVSGQMIVLTLGADGEPSLWSFNSETLTLITDARFEDSTYPPCAVGVVSDRLVYAQYLEGSNTEQVYWSTDGENAIAIATLADADDTSYPFFSRGTVNGETMYFAASTPEYGSELWATDGLTTWLAADINPGPASSSPQSHIDLNGQLLFVATTPSTGNELWALGGDGSSPQLVQDIYPGEADGISRFDLRLEVTVWNSHLYFRATDGIHGSELWRSDGQTAELVADILPGPGGSYPAELVDLGNRLAFFSPAVEPDYPLYSYDGQTVEELFDAFALPSG